MDLKLVKNIIRVDVYGEKIEISKPNIKQVMDYQKKVKDDSDDLEIVLDFLAELGLPKDKAYTLTPDDLQLIVEALVSSKKK